MNDYLSVYGMYNKQAVIVVRNSRYLYQSIYIL